MLCSRNLFILSISLLIGAQQAAAQEVSLKFKFPDGRVSTEVVETKTAQTLNLAGNEVVTASDQKMTVITKNGKRDAEGFLTRSSQIAALKASVSLPGGVELEYDSAKPDADPPGTQFDVLLDIFKATAKSKWTTKLNDDNEIVAVEGRGDFLEELPAAIQESLKGQVEEDYLKQNANDDLQQLPSEPVSVGDKWTRDSMARLEAGQKLSFTTEYTYEGVVEKGGKKLHKISPKVTKVGYSAEEGSPLKVVESDLKPTESTGQILFDNEAGKIVSASSKVQIKGTLTLNIAGMELPGDLDLTLASSTKQKK